MSEIVFSDIYVNGKNISSEIPFSKVNSVFTVIFTVIADNSEPCID